MTAFRAQRWTYRFERDDTRRIVGMSLDRRVADQVQRSVRLEGHRAVPVVDAVVEVLRRGGVTGRQLAADRPVELADPPGPQVELLLDAVRPVRRHDRVVGIAEGVAAMSIEEATYWHARAQRPGGLPALRMLLVGGPR